MKISDVISSVRVELDDTKKSRWKNDPDVFDVIKRALRRLSHILFVNDIVFGKRIYRFPTVAGTEAYNLPTDFMTDSGLFDTDQNRAILKLTEVDWFTISDATECQYWMVMSDGDIDSPGHKLFLKKTPSGIRNLALVYWPTVDIDSLLLTSDMPYGGKFDDIIIEYVALRLKNIDEMTITVDTSLWQEIEGKILLTYGTVAPLALRGKGWLPSSGSR